MARDYYDVLGVTKSASADEIRSAYRKLARKYHPDVNKAPEAQKSFTEVQQAYDVLSDEQKRKLYDQFGAAAFESGGAASAPGRASSGGAGPHYAWSNVGGANGPNFNYEGMDFDGEDVGSVFEAIFGGRQGAPGPTGRGARGRSRSSAGEGPTRPAEDVRSDITVAFLTAARGGIEKVRISDSGKPRTIEVTIPAGTEEGTQMRVRGEGGGQRDLILRIHIGAHPMLRRGEFAETGKGLDLYLDLPLTIAEASLGAVIPVPTLSGSVELQVPPGTPSGKRLRLRGRGIHDTQGRQGDLYATVKIVPPVGKELSQTEREQLQIISDRTASPRAGAEWKGSF